MFIKCPPIANLDHHEKILGPTLNGISLVPVGNGVIEFFRRVVSSSTSVLTATEVSQHCLSVVKQATDQLTAFAAHLGEGLSMCRDYSKTAEQLARNPIAGDEATTIEGMLASVEALLHQPMPQSKDLQHLRKHIGAISGFDPMPIVAALQDVNAVLIAIMEAQDALREIKVRLLQYAEQARDPATLEHARARRVSVKVARSLPSALSELHALRSKTSSIVDELDLVIKRLEDVA